MGKGRVAAIADGGLHMMIPDPNNEGHIVWSHSAYILSLEILLPFPISL
jgi:hypothetical protein